MAERQAPDMRARGIIARLNVKFARAHAVLDDILNETGGSAELLEFVPMAAKAGTASLPEETMADGDDNLAVAISPAKGVIEVTISALGFARAEEVAGRHANFRSHDGALDYDFRFDTTGTARLTLADSPSVRAGILSGWQILIER
ncbi:MAG: hypothetical protein AAGH83_00695 [Pseudomonadota bacterium]